MAAVAPREQLNAHIDSMYASGMVDEQFQKLQTLQDYCSSRGFVAAVVTFFCDAADEMITELSKMLEQPTVDFVKVDACVHELKESSASVGAQKVKSTCMQFRQLCQDKNRDGCIMALAVVKNEFCDVHRKFQTMIQLEQLIPAHE